jgi:sec-independent protein translocase protein TatB
MLDFNPSELLLVAIVALVVIGPKDLPKAMRFVGQWVGKARAVGRQFRSGFDAMVREAELEEMETRWKEENERIMREHPAEPIAPEASTAETPALPDESEAPAVMTPKPDTIGGLVDEAPAPSPDHEPHQTDRAPMLDLPMPPAPPAKP